MHWMKVSIKESDVAAKSATDLMEQFLKSYSDAGAPEDAKVYHLRIPAVGHAYYFSPKASSVAKSVLAEFRAVVLLEQPNLKELDPIAL